LAVRGRKRRAPRKKVADVKVMPDTLPNQQTKKAEETPKKRATKAKKG